MGRKEATEQLGSVASFPFKVSDKEYFIENNLGRDDIQMTSKNVKTPKRFAHGRLTTRFISSKEARARIRRWAKRILRRWAKKNESLDEIKTDNKKKEGSE